MEQPNGNNFNHDASRVPAEMDVTIDFAITRQPSHSKGWGRIKATDEQKRPIISSRTGNEWVSANHAGTMPLGERFTLTLQTNLHVGKGRTAREELQVQDFRLIADPGQQANCAIENGYLVIHVNNARLEAI